MAKVSPYLAIVMSGELPLGFEPLSEDEVMDALLNAEELGERVDLGRLLRVAKEGVVERLQALRLIEVDTYVKPLVKEWPPR